jgi:hypothetical protein
MTSGELLAIAVAGLGASCLAGFYMRWRRRRRATTLDDVVTPTWLNEHAYRKDGDRRW